MSKLNPSSNPWIDPILKAFPKSFGFYDLGWVELQEQEDSLFEENPTTAITFRMHGDIEAWIVILFDRNLDLSTYSELGNVLVSKIANQLDLENGLGVMISPPHLLEPLQLYQAKRNSARMIRKTYSHFYKNIVIPIETWIIPASSEEFGYA